MKAVVRSLLTHFWDGPAMTIDVIRLALSGDVDWGKFEAVVTEVLRSHDLPEIRRLGGGADSGRDAVMEAFYQNERQLDVVVQITSQVSQRLKVADTLAKFEEHKIKPRRVVFVFRGDCTTSVRQKILDSCAEKGFEGDVRDRTYLVTELAREGSSIFRRYFSGVRDQVDALLSDADPLATSPEKLRKAVLAALSAYVLSDRSITIRGRIFVCSVLAVISSSKNGMDLQEIRDGLAHVLPEGAAGRFDDAQVIAAIDSLKGDGSVTIVGSKYLATEPRLAEIGLAIEKVRQGFSALFGFVLEHVRKRFKLSDAQEGSLEINCRSAITQLIRFVGPVVDSSQAINHDNDDSGSWLLPFLSRYLNGDIAKSALFALNEFMADAERRESIFPLFRSYSALAIRNLDPFGRKWQSAVLGRSMVVLDTDALLNVLIQELPLSKPLTEALRAFSRSGAEIIVPDRVLAEAILHIERAGKTYTAVGGDRVALLTEEVVHATVWNALVTGFWYARQIDPALSWGQYRENYYDRDDPRGYLTALVNRRISAARRLPFDSMDLADGEAFESLFREFMGIEEDRNKSKYRDEDDRGQRLSSDIKLVLRLAREVGDKIGQASGYLVSEDKLFWNVERSNAWSPRGKVSVRTRVLPELAALCCGADIADDVLVKLLFEPASVALGEMLKHEVRSLARTGVDLSHSSVERLEWNLEKGLRAKVHAFEDALRGDDGVLAEAAAVEVLVAANDGGLNLYPVLAEVAKNYDASKGQNQAMSAEMMALRNSVRDSIIEAAGSSRKGRTRANQALAKLGLQPF